MVSSIARRIGAAVGVLLLILLGVFWTGHESSHGSLSVFWEHWWCPLPLAIVVLGVVSLVRGAQAHRSRLKLLLSAGPSRAWVSTS